ncbi:BRO1-like domain-containing protein [Papiliotrema laurentii]|uniref:BRO domain-containing protein 1 n=1 Tax=Papiliotrema laurentii TaxID=5418 RepID=A0AAD9L9H5_PAPLA|nr:BRO1-like domain-containing protein [Papiliotrema laurentii]
MAFQSPLISIPKKTTGDVDWSGPIRTVIAQSFGEDPNNYAEEISVLQRCRQDAVRGAGSDQTARDLLYKYFGQLELLELRFSEIKVPFPWNDAFTLKQTTQTSLAFEKASIIHLLASVLSSLAAGTSRSDPEGVKRAYFNLRASAGMLTYINENFLHAPSTDLSREVVHLLIGILMAQATEVFTEKLIDEKKAPGLVCRSANSAAAMYTTLVDEMKEFQGKGVFDRNWLFVLQIKARLYASMAQYYRSTADAAAGKHGAALVRMKLADTAAQDASRQAASFGYSFYAAATPSLPHDAATSLAEITKAHATVCSEAKEQAVKDNDLIYHDILPSEASLPAIEKLPAATPITIQEVYQNQDVSKLIGPDIFIRLVPLAVHESASVYSEEKAKLVRGEVERVDLNEGEIRAALEHLGLPGVLGAWRKIAEDEESAEADIEISGSLNRLAEDVQRERQVESLLRSLDAERERCERELRELNGLLDNESRECERMRAKYNPQFTQSPSGPQTSHFRSTISSNLGSLSAAATSDGNLNSLWRDIQPDISVLAQGPGGLRHIGQQVAAGKSAPVPQPGVSLLDLDEEVGGSKSGLDEKEKEELEKAIAEAQERIDRLGKIRRERDEVLKDLKEKIQNDDVSNLLLLNRRSQNVEPQLFASELEKFRPFQGRLAAAVQASTSILQELEMLVKQVEKGKGVREKQKGSKERQKRVREWERRLEQAGEGWNEVKAGAGKGLSFYDSMSTVLRDLDREVRSWVKNREAERARMVSDIETRQRISSSPPPLPSASGGRGIESQFSGLSLGSDRYTSPPPPQPPKPYSPTPGLPPPPPQSSTPSYLPPPPSQKASSPYDFSSLSGSSAFSTAPSPPATGAPQQRQGSYGYPAPPAQPPSNAYPSHPPPSSNMYPSHPPPSQPSSNAYPAPPQPQRPQQSYAYQPPQPQPSAPVSAHTYGQSSAPYPPPPARQGSASYYPPPPVPHGHGSPPPASTYPSYAPPAGYTSPPPQPTQPQQQYQPPTSGYGGYPQQPPPQQQAQGGYQYGSQGYGYR